MAVMTFVLSRSCWCTFAGYDFGEYLDRFPPSPHGEQIRRCISESCHANHGRWILGRSLKLSIGKRLFGAVLLAYLTIGAVGLTLARWHLADPAPASTSPAETDAIEALKADLQALYRCSGSWSFLPSDAAERRDWLRHEFRRLQQMPQFSDTGDQPLSPTLGNRLGLVDTAGTTLTGRVPSRALIAAASIDTRERTLALDGAVIARLVDDLAALAQPEVGGLRCEMQQLTAWPLVLEVSASFSDMAHAAGLQVDLGGAPARSAVRGDRLRLRQVFCKVFENSLRYTAAGGRIEAVGRTQADVLHILIADTAPGVPPNLLDRVGERFFRVEPSRSRSSRGAGLGPALCRRIVESHADHIESRTPRWAACASTSRCRWRAEVNGNILIVEDESDLAAIMAEYVSAAGYAVRVLADGREALASVRSRVPALIVLDIMLPDLDGIAPCHAVHGFSDVPIIMVTARVQEIDRLLGLETGAEDYRCKSFSPRELGARIKAVLRRRQPPAPAVGEPSFQVDEATRRIRLGAQLLELTPSEYGLLAALLRRPGTVFSRAQLLDLARGEAPDVADRAVASHIKNLRRKLADQAPGVVWIQTVVISAIALGIVAVVGMMNWRPGVNGPPQKDAPMNVPARQEVIESLISTLKQFYVFPEQAAVIERGLRAQVANGEFDRTDSAKHFVRGLTESVQALVPDRHLEVRYFEAPIPMPAAGQEDEDSPEKAAAFLQEGLRLNFGVETVGRLKCNLGYIDRHQFGRPSRLLRPSRLR